MSTTIRDIMTHSVSTLSPDDDLMKADAIMRGGRIRHLPVVSDGKLVGLITHRDLLRAQIAALSAMTAISVSPSTRDAVLAQSPTTR